MKLVHDIQNRTHLNLFRVSLIIIILVFLTIVISCTKSVLIEATQDDPILIEEKDLSGKLSNYRKYTYDWFSKAMNVTSEIRGLDFTRNLYFFSTNTQELGELLGEYERSQTEEEIMEDFFKQIGFLSTEESFADLYGEDQEEDYSSIAGFYGIGTNTFVIVEDFNVDENPYRPLRFEDVVLVHELTHALQDMNFNLTRLITSYQDTTDSLMSVKALAEGDATLTQYLFYINEHRDFRNLDEEEKENLIRRISDRFSSFGYGGTIESDVPDYWLKEAVFVYLQGAGFVSQLYLAGGFELVNEAFTNQPPLSTEQILHPVKYIENDIPSVVFLTDISTQLNNTPDGLWNMEYEDTLGEFNIYVLMDKYLSDKGINYANRVSEGWDGDKVNFYVNYKGEEDALVWVTAWDTEKDAREFFDAYISLMVNKTNPDLLSINKYTKDNIIWNKEGGFVNSIYIKDNSVYIIEDIPEDSFEEVSQVILSSEIDFNLEE